MVAWVGRQGFDNFDLFRMMARQSFTLEGDIDSHMHISNFLRCSCNPFDRRNTLLTI